MYLTNTTPDIAYVVHVVCQFVISLTIVHWVVVLCILHYLRGTQFQSLLFSSTSSLALHAYSDADWVGDPINHQYTTGFCIVLGDSFISWKSKIHDIIFRSSTKAEYHTMAPTTAEIVWLRWLLFDMGVSLYEPIFIYCDNKSFI